jgi:hypothetical protein
MTSTVFSVNDVKISPVAGALTSPIGFGINIPSGNLSRSLLKYSIFKTALRVKRPLSGHSHQKGIPTHTLRVFKHTLNPSASIGTLCSDRFRLPFARSSRFAARTEMIEEEKMQSSQQQSSLMRRGDSNRQKDKIQLETRLVQNPITH